MSRVSSVLVALSFCLSIFVPASERENRFLYPGIRTPEALLRGSLPPFSTVREAMARTCKIAARPIPPELPLVLYEDDLQTIRSYKSSWLALCEGRSEKTLPEAFRLARQLEDMLRIPLFREGLPPPGEQRSMLVYERLDALDTFIPAFYGHAENTEVYGFIRSIFYLAALQGSAEDRLFFQLHFTYRRQAHLFPWQNDPLCANFGDYDWIQSLRELRHAQTTLQNPIYRQALNEWERAIYFLFDARHEDFCVCQGDRQDLLIDAEAIGVFLTKFPDRENSISPIKELIDALHQGKKRVRSFAEEGCIVPY